MNRKMCILISTIIVVVISIFIYNSEKSFQDLRGLEVDKFKVTLYPENGYKGLEQYSEVDEVVDRIRTIIIENKISKDEYLEPAMDFKIIYNKSSQKNVVGCSQNEVWKNRYTESSSKLKNFHSHNKR